MSLHVANRRLLERFHDDSVDFDAEFVVSPPSIEDAAEVLAVAADAGAPVSFLGGGTDRNLGNPVDAAVLITSRAMDRIVQYDPDDLTIVVEPGVTLARLDEVLAERRLTAVMPEDRPRATVGGVVATGRSGYRRLRYGPTRDRVLQVTAATGYGEVITGGSPVVKASTGYGLPRLFTGSLGSLGMIGPIRLKLWAEPMASATVVVDDPEAARRVVYRPVAVLGFGGISCVYLSGTGEEVDAQTDQLGGTRRDGLEWPAPAEDALRLSFRVPAGHTAEAVDRARNLNAFNWIAQYGVGLVEAGYGRLPPDGVAVARSWAESVGGALVIEASDVIRSELGAWGLARPSMGLQGEVKSRFDPVRICNPGILPGGL